MNNSYRETALTVLELSESARNSDWDFLFGFLDISANIVIPHHIREQIKSSDLNLNTITRERRYVQNTLNMFKADPEVLARRKQKQEEHRQTYKKN